MRDFRGYGDARAALGAGLTVVSGANGAGKTNLLEALYFACTGRSCRTTNEREVVRFGSRATRVAATTEAEDGTHELSVAFVPGEAKQMRVDGAAVERLLDVPGRPLISVFLPDRLELIKGPPGARRAHLDQFIAALRPARVGTRRAYAQALAQRNALLARVRAGRGSRDALPSWDTAVARHGVMLMRERAVTVEAVAERFSRISSELGLDGEAEIFYHPRSRAEEPEQLAEELAERLEADLERGYTTHGPHRDDVALSRDRHDLRAYGSQGQQRLALLALLLAEREALAATRAHAPLMLLDDVMSELDRDRREALLELLRSSGGQAVITTTDLEHVPDADGRDIAHLAVREGRIMAEVIA
jgi:DNA replication and repair protein RecF